MAADSCCLGGLVPAGLEDPADGVAGLVMPGGFDQQPADVAVAGLGDAALAAMLAGGVLGGDQAEVGPDAGSGEPLPVADLILQQQSAFFS